MRRPIVLAVCLAAALAPLAPRARGEVFILKSGGRIEGDLYGLQNRDRVERMLEWIELVKRLWTEDNVTFDSHFFSPHGFFTAQLNYPGQPVTLQIAISQGATKWLIENITVSMQQMR